MLLVKTLTNMSRLSHVLTAPALSRVIFLVVFTLSISGTFAAAIPPLKRALPPATPPGPIPTRAPAPPVPSVEECKGHIDPPPTNRSLFYSLDQLSPARTFAMENELFLLENRIDKTFSDLADSPDSPWSQSQKDLFWQRCSQGFAELTSGITFVVLPRVIPVAERIWKSTEYNTLVDNTRVLLIVKVIAENFSDQTILWPCSRGGTEYTCPDNRPFTGGTNPTIPM